MRQNLKIIAMFLSLAALSAYFLYSSYHKVVSIFKESSYLYLKQDLKHAFLSNMYAATRDRSLILLKMLDEDDAFELDDLNMQLGGAARQYIYAREQYLSAELSDGERALLQAQDSAVVKNALIQEQVASLFLQGKKEQATHLLYRIALPAQTNVMSFITKGISYDGSNNTQLIRRLSREFEEAGHGFLFLGILIAIMSFIMLVITVSRSSRKEHQILLQTLREREKSADELTEANERFKLVAESSFSAIWEWDVKKDQLFLSSQCRLLHGLSDDPSNTIDSLIQSIHPDDKDTVKIALQKHIEGDANNFKEEYRLVLQDGSIRWVFNQGLVQFKNGEAVRVAGSEVDITEKKLIEISRNLQEGRRQLITKILEISISAVKENNFCELVLAQLIQSSIGINCRQSMLFLQQPRDSSGAFTLVAQAHADKNIESNCSLSADEQTQRMNKLDKIQVAFIANINKKINLCEFYKEASLSLYSIPIKKVQNAEDKTIGFLLLYVDKSDVADENMMRLLDNVSFIIGTTLQRLYAETSLKDFNHRLELTIVKRTQDLLVAAQSEKQANRAKTDFLNNVSHELRTPIHGIIALSQLGYERLREIDFEKLEKYFTTINDSGQRLLTLVNDLLDLSKLEAGKIILDLERHSLISIVQRCADEQMATLQNKNIALDITSNCQEQQNFILDNGKIHQVILNLLSNALKFSPNNSCIESSITVQAEKVIFSLQDQGAGIPVDEIDDIFDKFVQSSKTKDKTGSTGLGLAICREIITLHQGEIWAENPPQGGARVSFTIPLKLKAL